MSCTLNSTWSTTMPINVYDNPVSPELCEAARIWLLSQGPIFGWRAHAVAPGAFWHRNFVLPGTHLHLYGKAAARPGRKMGHVTVVSDDFEFALAEAKGAAAVLLRG